MEHPLNEPSVRYKTNIGRYRQNPPPANPLAVLAHIGKPIQGVSRTVSPQQSPDQEMPMTSKFVSHNAKVVSHKTL